MYVQRVVPLLEYDRQTLQTHVAAKIAISKGF